MAEIVLTAGVPHTPLLWRLLREPIPEDLQTVASNFDRFRELLAIARPDVIVFVASDHFRQLATSNMPAFMIGKAAEMRGTHPNEERAFGLPFVPVPGDPEAARLVLGHHELPDGFDFAYSDEPWLDHSFMVPLLYLTPQLDVPVVPVYTNTNAPPLPSARRFVELGRYLRTSLLGSSLRRRVAIIGTGHLAFELGGPRQFLGTSPDPEFDGLTLEWMAKGAVEEAIEACSFERLLSAGNLTFQFLNFLTCLAAAGARPATIAEATPCRFGHEPFFAWEED